MRHLVTGPVYPLGAILGAHGLVYLLMGALPDAAVSALGLFSADEELLSAFAQSNPPRTYLETFVGVFKGDLGQTLDGQAVTDALLSATMESAPRFGIAVLLLVAVCFVTAMCVRERTSLLQSAGDFLAFLPPYVAPFLGLALVLQMQFSTGSPFPGAGLEVIAIVSLSVGSGALLAAQTARITQRNLKSDFATSVKAAGASLLQVRRRLLHNLVVEIAPTFEKMVVSLMVALIFTETILGLGGFGTLAVRAVRRSDIDLVLGVTLVVASVVAIARISIWGIRTNYGVEE